MEKGKRLDRQVRLAGLYSKRDWHIAQQKHRLSAAQKLADEIVEVDRLIRALQVQIQRLEKGRLR